MPVEKTVRAPASRSQTKHSFMARAATDDLECPSKERWLALVVCEDELAHARALSICENLTRRFWGEIEFALSWWLFTNLECAVNAEEAAHVAMEADMIFLATQPHGDFPEKVISWIETWAKRRGDREGALVWITGDESAPSGGPRQLYLRQVAHRAGMDFLSEIPESPAPALPESPEWFANRARAMGTVMDGILKQTGSPPELVLQ